MYVSSSMVFERATEFPTTEEHLATCPAPHSAYGFSKLAGEVYCRALHDEHGLPYTICRPFNAYGPGRDARRGAGDRARRARPDPQGAGGTAAAADLRQRRADTHAHAHRRHRRGRRGGDGAPGRRGRGLQHLGERRADCRGDRGDHLGGVRRGPGRVRARAPAHLRGGRAAPLALGREGARPARLGGADRRARRDRGDGRVDARAGAGSAEPSLRHGRRGVLRRHQVLGVLRSRGQDPVAPDRDELELLDLEAVRAAVRSAAPPAVYHLAAQASVPASWSDPRDDAAREPRDDPERAGGGRRRPPRPWSWSPGRERSTGLPRRSRSRRARRCARRTRTRCRRPRAICSPPSTRTPTGCT